MRKIVAVTLAMIVVLALGIVSASAAEITADSASELLSVLKNKVFTEDTTIKITSSFTASDWEKFTVGVAEGATLTIDGQGNTITGLNYPLISGVAGSMTNINVASKGNLTIKNLTLANAAVKSVDYNGSIYSAAAYTAYVNMTGDLVFEDCHVINGSIVENQSTSQSYAGAFVAYVNTPMNISLLDCSVDESNVKSNGQAGGMIAYANCSGHTVTIKNSAITDTTVTTTEIEDGEPRADKVGGLVSTNNGSTQLVIENLTATGNTVKAADQETGMLVGRNNGTDASITVKGDCWVDFDFNTSITGKNKGEVQTTNAVFHVATDGNAQGTVSHPQTGDSSNLMLWACLMIMAACGMVVISRKRLSADR